MTSADVSSGAALPRGLVLVDHLVDGELTVFLRAFKETSGAPAIVQAMRAGANPTRAVARLRHDFEVSRLSAGAHVLRPMELTSDGRALLYEPFEAVALGTLLRRPLDLATSLRVSLALLDALGSIHEKGIVHRNVEPRTVLVDLARGTVKLVGFGAASRLSSTAPEPNALNGLEGSLAYVSPEQTGRIRSAVDYRSDFYSFGVVLYEMFARRRPFAMIDPLQLVHAHLTRRPAAPHEVDATLPEPLSDIVLKLLAKDAEERYQSHGGIRADLEDCLAAIGRGERPSSFPLGRRDASGRFQLPRRLYGRERELAMVQAAFERTVGGETEALCLIGYAGIGKSALVSEVRRSMVAQGGCFFSGKFDQLRRGSPYSALLEALRDLCRQLLMEGTEALASVRALLREALGDNGRVLTDVIPELESILGPQGAVQDVPPAEAQARFKQTLARFIGVFGMARTAAPATGSSLRPARPLVLFLDDVQWADSASLDFLEHLVLSGIRRLLVIAAHRESDAGAAPPIERMFESIRARGVRIARIELAPLDTDTITRLVADTMHVQPAECAELAARIHEKTAGNPFFATELLKTLHQEGAIAFEANAGRWKLDRAAIEAAAVTANVVELMCRKIDRLSEAAREMLKRAACIDNRFDLETLGVACDDTGHDLLAAIDEAMKAGLLLSVADVSSDSGEIRPGCYRFLHDRVQQAAYSLIPEDARAAAHLRIGRLLLGECTDEELGERLFDVVDHLNRGRELLPTGPHAIQSGGERLRLARLNLLAARRAKASVAFELAHRYAEVGLELLGGSRGEHAGLAAALLADRGECAHVASRFDEAARDFRDALAFTWIPLERARILELEMRMHVTRGEYDRVIASALEGARVLGFECPEYPSKIEVAAAIVAIKWRLRGRSLQDLRALPVMSRPEPAFAVRLLMGMSSATYLVRKNLLAMSVLKAMDICLTHGHAAESAAAYLLYGMVVGVGFGDEASGYPFGELGLQLAERFGDRMQLGRGRFTFACMLNHWRAPVRTNLAHLETALRDCTESGDRNWAAYARSQLTVNKLVLGFPLEQQRIDAEHFSILQRHGIFEGRFHQRAVLRYVECLAGRTRAIDDMSGPGFDEAAFRGELYSTEYTAVRVLYTVIKQQLAYLAGDLGGAESAARASEEVLNEGLGQLIFVEYHFWAGLARAGLLSRERGTARVKLRVAIEGHLHKLRGWAKGCAVNFLHKQQLVEAELARARGQSNHAITLYERAIRSAAEAGIPHLEALANELAGRFHASAGRERVAHEHLRSAYDAYTLWGAAAKARMLERDFPDLGPSAAPVSVSPPPSGDVLDLAAVTRAAQAISGEMQLEDLLCRVLTLTIENAGAERAFLILKNGDELFIEASIHGDETLADGPMPLDACDALSHAIVRHVVRTGETVLLADASVESAFLEDPYILRRQPKSVLASPLFKQGTLIGVLYLENNMAPRAFTPARLELLHILSSQAAISIENAKLYRDLREHNRTLEQKVEVRTAELQGKNAELASTLERLREMQEQLVARDKLASLGSLTAGMAHELKNPLNFITNFAELSLPLADEIEGALDPVRGRLGGDVTESIAGALADLRLNVSKIHEHGKRADRIIGNMLRHAHSAGGNRVETDLNGLVAQSVELAAHSLKTRIEGFHVAFSEDYESGLGYVMVAPSEIGQAFLNVLDNAIYAMAQKSKRGGSGYRAALAVRTRRNGDRIEVSFRDNGTGMPKEVLARIYEPFYTTKPAGEGTGLGLSISHDILRGHHGEILTASVPGESTEVVIVLPAAINQDGREHRRA